MVKLMAVLGFIVSMYGASVLDTNLGIGIITIIFGISLLIPGVIFDSVTREIEERRENES